MKHILEADPEVMSYLLLDPTTVAEEFKTANATGSQVEVLRRLHQEQKLFLIESEEEVCDRLHVYVDEPTPEHLTAYLQNTETIDAFIVTGGELHFTGAQCGPHHGEEDTPGHGESCPLPNGTYRISLSKLEYPEDHLKEQFAKRATKWQRIAYNGLDRVMITMGLLVLFALTSFLWLPGRYFVLMLLCIAVPAVLFPQFYCKWSAFREGQKVYEGVHADHPELVASVDQVVTAS